jgi:carbamoyl-phosphate synthase large subunit
VSTAAGTKLPLKGTVLLTVADKDKPEVSPLAKRIKGMGFEVCTTEGTGEVLKDNGVSTKRIKKLHEGRPNIADAIKNKEIQLVINTPSGKLSVYDDSYIRKTAIKYKIPYITTLAAAIAAAKGIAAYRQGKGSVRSLQSYHRDIT